MRVTRANLNNNPTLVLEVHIYVAPHLVFLFVHTPRVGIGGTSDFTQRGGWFSSIHKSVLLTH